MFTRAVGQQLLNQLEAFTMVTTRSMSRSNPTSKSVATKTVKPPKCFKRNLTREALSIFMIKEYLPQYYEANLPCPTEPNPFEPVRSGHEKLSFMSESEKAPWIELAGKMLPKGISLRDTVEPRWFELLEASN